MSPSLFTASFSLRREGGGREVWEVWEDRKESARQRTKMGEKEKGKKYFRTHEDLAIYQLAFETAMQIFEYSKKFPVEEKYSCF